MSLQDTRYGQTAFGTDGSQDPSAETAYAIPITVTDDGWLVAIEAGVGGTASTLAGAVGLYADDGGQPGALLHGHFSLIGVPVASLSTTSRWFSFPLFYWITAGDYWISWENGQGSGAAALLYETGVTGDGYEIAGGQNGAIHEPGATGVTLNDTDRIYSLQAVVLEFVTTQAATVTPAVVPLIVTVPTPTVLAGVAVTPAVVALVATVPTPAILAASVVTPAVVALVATVPTPVVSIGATVTPATVAAVVTVPTPTVLAASTVTPGTVVLVVTVPTPTVQGGVTVTPGVVVAVATVPTPAVQAGVAATPAVIVLTATVPTPTIHAAVVVTPGVIPVVVVVAIPTPTIGINPIPTLFTGLGVSTIQNNTTRRILEKTTRRLTTRR